MPKRVRQMPKKPRGAVQERLDALRLELASTPLSTSGLVKRFAKEWKIGERQIRMYVTWLRDEMRADHVQDAASLREEMILQVKAHYGACMAKKSYAAAGRAQDRLIALYGLNIQRVELTGRDGAPVRMVTEEPEIKVDGLMDEELALLGKVVRQLQAGTSPEVEKEEADATDFH